MKTFVTPLTALYACAALTAAVPSEINYQGRLTDANGDAVTGDVAMSLKMFDAATEGNEIYSEDIGTVTLDSNGIYSFEFGAGGQSVVSTSETIATTDGFNQVFNATLKNLPVDGSVSVSDGTYSWSQANGSSSSTEFSASVTPSSGAVSAIYLGSAPTTSVDITASYNYMDATLSGALSSHASHWLELSVDGIAQYPRERVLSVPFAQVAKSSQVSSYANQLSNESELFASTESLSRMLDELAMDSLSLTSNQRLCLFDNNTDSLVVEELKMPWISGQGLLGIPPVISSGGTIPHWGNIAVILMDNINTTVSSVHYTVTVGSSAVTHNVTLNYSDGSATIIAEHTGALTDQYFQAANPYPEKIVTSIEFRGGGTRAFVASINFSNASFVFEGTERSFTARVSEPITAKQILVYLEPDLIQNNPDLSFQYYISSGESEYGPYNFGEKVTLPDYLLVEEIRAVFEGTFSPEYSAIKKLLLRRIR